MAHSETSPNPPEFVVSPEGLQRVIVAVAGKLVEADEADRSAASTQPGSLGNIAQAHHIQEAALLRREVRLVGSVLDEIIERPDGTPWLDFIEAEVSAGAPPKKF